MTDLEKLFGADPGASKRTGERAPDNADSEFLPQRSAAEPRPPQNDQTTRLSRLVGDRPAAEGSRSAGPGAGLRHLVGSPSTTVEGAQKLSLSTSRGLSALDEPRGIRIQEGGWLAPELARAGARPRFGGRRRQGALNVLSILAATLAVLALVGAVSLALVQRATANPADEAMVSLREREGELANDTKMLETSVGLLAAATSEATTLVESGGPVLAGLNGRVSGPELGASEAARVALQDLVAATTPVTVPQYSRTSINEKSLPQVARAIDTVRQAREALPPLLSEARDARARVAEGSSAFRESLRLLGVAIQMEASRIVAANRSVRDSFRTDISDTAARVLAAQEAGGDGLAEMSAYSSAVDALRAENVQLFGVEDESLYVSSQNTSGRTPTSGATPTRPAVSPAPAPDPQPTRAPAPTAGPTPAASQTPTDSATPPST